jgi:hypothetical protein
VGHEQDPAVAGVNYRLERTFTLEGIPDAGFVLQAETIQENSGKILELPPGAPEVVCAAFAGEKHCVKTETD